MCHFDIHNMLLRALKYAIADTHNSTSQCTIISAPSHYIIAHCKVCKLCYNNKSTKHNSILHTFIMYYFNVLFYYFQSSQVLALF